MCNHSPPLECKMPTTRLWQKQKLEGHVKYHRNNDLVTASLIPPILSFVHYDTRGYFVSSWFQTLREISSSHLRPTQVQYREGKNYAKILRGKKCDWTFQKEILVYGIFKREKLTCKEEKLIFKHFHSLNQVGSWTWESFWWSKRGGIY